MKYPPELQAVRRWVQAVADYMRITRRDNDEWADEIKRRKGFGVIQAKKPPNGFQTPRPRSY